MRWGTILLYKSAGPFLAGILKCWGSLRKMDSNSHKHEIFVIAVCKLLVLSCKALDSFSNRGYGTWKTCKFFLLAFVVICDRKKRHLKPNYSRPQHWSEKSMARRTTTQVMCSCGSLYLGSTLTFHCNKVFFLHWWSRQNLWCKDLWGLFNFRQAQGTSDLSSASKN